MADPSSFIITSPKTAMSSSKPEEKSGDAAKDLKSEAPGAGRQYSEVSILPFPAGLGNILIFPLQIHEGVSPSLRAEMAVRRDAAVVQPVEERLERTAAELGTCFFSWFKVYTLTHRTEACLVKANRLAAVVNMEKVGQAETKEAQDAAMDRMIAFAHRYNKFKRELGQYK